jgi:hypothetical protein
MVEPASPAQTESETDPLVLKNLEHFKDMKFGLMMHWGVYSIWGAVESWPICDAEPYGRNALPQWEQSGKNVETFMKMYFDLNTQFNPIHFKPEAWADAANDAGMKYLVFTTKHHDGFCMYDTRQKTTGPHIPCVRSTVVRRPISQKYCFTRSASVVSESARTTPRPIGTILIIGTLSIAA